MNKAESERIGRCFEEHGYVPANSVTEADLIVLNSCVVRQSAENRVINKLQNVRQLKKKRPDIVLALTGCMVGPETEQLKKSYPYVDHFFKPGEHPSWFEQDKTRPPLTKPATPCVYVPIMQGCNNFCTYCIVPYRRGRERSRILPEIVEEVTELISHGAKEVTLLGQNVDSYGHDLPDRPELADLLHELNDISGLSRIRFLTNHPKDITPRLISAVAGLDKVCEQICLPVQSGSDDILKAMKRGYTIEQYRNLIGRIRREIPGVALSTDVIVGFPSETDAQFRQTVDLLSETKFDTVHVAAYSPRKGTAAERSLEDNVPLLEKKERLGIVERLQEKTAGDINARLLGESVEVLVEGKSKGKLYGRTRTDKLVFFADNDNCRGQLIKIKIDKTSPWSLQGKVEADIQEDKY